LPFALSGSLVSGSLDSGKFDPRGLFTCLSVWPSSQSAGVIAGSEIATHVRSDIVQYCDLAVDSGIRTRNGGIWLGTPYSADVPESQVTKV